VLTLAKEGLLTTLGYVGGQWRPAADGATFDVVNPADGGVVARVADYGADEAADAIAAAEAALPAWRAALPKERSDLLRRWHDLVLQHQEDLARILTAEQGKPLAEARGEILYGTSFIEWFAEEGKRIYGDTMTVPGRDKRILVVKQPVGVVAAITPWNFPNAMITRKIAPALAAGCTVIVKPSEETPLSALALMVLAEEAGMPAGVLNVLATTKAAAVGGRLMASSAVRKVSFTGSTAVGKQLMRQSAATLKKLSLELGGNAPFIVFDDADIDAAVAGLLVAKFRNAGQTCVCANRILVQSAICDRFLDAFVKAVATLCQGDGAEAGTSVGPLINSAAVDKVSALVAGAQAGGARALLGGGPAARAGHFFQPTVLADVSPAMEIARSEVFGPVAPVMRFETEAQAIRLANDTPYGLAAYFYARDLGRVIRVYEALEYGMVGVNDGAISSEIIPFGGMKESGFGREGSKYGIDEYLQLKSVSLAGFNLP